MRSRYLALTLLACAAGAAHAQTQAAAMNANQLKWAAAPSFLPKGCKLAVLSGNPMAAGNFVIRLKMPPGYQVPAHWHSSDEILTIISGTLYAGMGDKLDKSKSMPLHTGAFAAMPAKMHHFAWTKGTTIVQVNAMGPFDIHYLDPKTDPTLGH